MAITNEDVKNMFGRHLVDANTAQKVDQATAQFESLAYFILQNTNPDAEQTVAIRKLMEAKQQTVFAMVKNPMDEFAKEASTSTGMFTKVSPSLVVNIPVIVTKIELGYDKKRFNVTFDNFNTGGEPELLMMTLSYKNRPNFQIGQHVTISLT